MPPAPTAAPASTRDPVPLIILTGFLGSGKTTVLNRVLAAQHHRRVAVLVNELGRIDIDAGLIRARAGDVLELTGGCVCHQIGVQRELWSALAEIASRSRPDVVVLETTGIAEPAAILRGLNRLGQDGPQDAPQDVPEDGYADEPPSALPAVRVAGVVTVVDAEAGSRQLEKHEEARDQVVAADRILISKTDIAPADRLAELHRRLRDLNPDAERAAFPATGAGTAALVPWLLDRHPHSAARTSRPSPATASLSSHAHQLAAATYVDDAPLVRDALLLACEALGDRLVRAKGFVHLAGEPRRGFLERAGDRTSLVLGAPWGDEPPMTRLVLIGDSLDEAALHRQLWACRAASGRPAA
jgi:G3E family GTPase